MVDTFTVDPLKGTVYRDIVFSRTLAKLLDSGVLFGITNNLDIDNTVGGLNFKVKTGAAIIDGHYIELTILSDSKSMPASVTRQIFISTTQASGDTTGAQIEILNGTTPSTPYIQIAELTSDATTITVVDQKMKVQARVANHGNDLFGDGSDGDLTIASGTTTLTETKYYNNIWVKSGANLTANEPMLLFVKGQLLVDGTVHMNGKGGAAGLGGTIGPSAPGPGGVGAPAPAPANVPGNPGGVGGAAGTGGGAGTTGSAGFAGAPGFAGGAGGAGGAGSPGAPGGSGAASTDGVGPAAPGGTLSRKLKNVYDWLGTSPRPNGIGAGGGGGGNAARGGGGGGGGAGDGPGANGGAGGAGGSGGAAGGDGGAGGGTLICFARNIRINSGGVISSNGNNGVNGASNPGASLVGGTGSNGVGTPSPFDGGGGGGGGGSRADGGGGGSGGNGGVVLLAYQSKINSGTIQAAGGTAGTGGSSPGAAHGAGGPGGTGQVAGTAGTPAGPGTGVAGGNGTAGAVGVVIEHLV